MKRSLKILALLTAVILVLCSCRADNTVTSSLNASTIMDKDFSKELSEPESFESFSEGNISSEEGSESQGGQASQSGNPSGEGTQGGEQENQGGQQTQQPDFYIPPEGNYTGNISVRMPVASGTAVYYTQFQSNNGSVGTVDYSNVSEGYVMCQQSSASRIKVQIVGPSGTYNYDLNNSGTYEVFPMNMGSGAYRVRIMQQNPESGKYAELGAVDINVSLNSSLSPYLYPNQYVNYSSASSVVRKSYNLSMNCSSDVEKVAAIYHFITHNVSYDYGKAASVSSGYIPNPESTLASRSGICFDYAALAAAMLRAQGIPTRLVIGYAPNGAYHAWNMIYLNNTGWITIKIQLSGGTWNLVDTTFAASNGPDYFVPNSGAYTTTEYH